MKRINLCLSILLLTMMFGFTSVLTAQSKTDFLNSKDKKATWLGLDFTELRVFGDSEADAQKIKDDYFGSINDLVLTEPDKYIVAKAFQVGDLKFDLSEVTKVNDQVDPDKLVTLKSEDLNRVKPEAVQEMVNRYDLSGKSGYGIVFIVDGFDKNKSAGTMYVTIIDMASKKVLLTKRMTGKAGGFGFRNYWARTVYEVLKSIDKSEYDKWKSGK